MTNHDAPFSRRRALAAGAGAVVGFAGVGAPVRPASAVDLVPLEVAYAGSMTSLMEGPIKQLAADKLGVDMHGRPQGSSGLAKLIVGGSIRPDVFVAVTPSPMRTVLSASKARAGVPVARTAMVIAYSPKSAFAPQFSVAAAGRSPAWWQVLEMSGIRFGRTDPNTDPQGRNIIYTMQLAALTYDQPDLVARILGEPINPAQIFSEPTIEARLQSGELDAASAYKIQPGPFGLPFVTLPATIDLSDDRRQRSYARAEVTLDGNAHHPEPLVYYAAALSAAPQAAKAKAFVDLLAGPEGQAVFHRFGYDPAGSAAPLHA
ncbi:MAG: extracellular solute-binding protein [Vulcanimicrobiaceae bacterium]